MVEQSAVKFDDRQKIATHFLRWHKFYGPMLLVLWLLMHALVNATTVIMEVGRAGKNIAYWEPFCWELTSVFWVGLLAWPVAKFLLVWPSHKPIWQSAAVHLLAALVFSGVHVLGMVAFRELWYWLAGSDYQFGHWGYEFLYELRKDGMAYITLVVLIQGFRFIVRRLQGEASVLSESEASLRPIAEQLLVKKLDREFLINIDDIDWVEAAGNYANLKAAGRTFPMRITMAKLTEQLPSERFIRIHRSTIVNLSRIQEVTPTDNGDYFVTLNCGQQLMLSRRYREAFRLRFVM